MHLNATHWLPWLRRRGSHYAAIYTNLLCNNYKKAAATTPSSNGKNVTYYSTPLQTLHDPAMNNFATLVPCTAVDLTPILEIEIRTPDHSQIYHIQENIFKRVAGKLKLGKIE
jgi:hypothetical protein